MVVDMDRLFIYDERSVGGTTVYFFEDQVISQRQLYVFGNFECFRGVQTSFSVEVLGASKSPGEYDVFYEFDLEGMAKFILDMHLSMYGEK